MESNKNNTNTKGLLHQINSITPTSLSMQQFPMHHLTILSEHLVYQSEIPSTTITLSAAFGK